MQAELDSDLLKTFIAIVDTGSFTKAATIVHRTQSAVSMQMKRLEEISEGSVFERDGRKIKLTRHGDKLQYYARRILNLNAEALNALKQSDLSGSINFGIPDDYVEEFLPQVLSSFYGEFPNVEVNFHCLGSNELMNKVIDGSIDLAIASKVPNLQLTHETEIRQEQCVWVGTEAYLSRETTQLSLAMHHGDCILKRWALDSLDKHNRDYRVAYISRSILGIIGYVRAGLGVTVMPRSSVPSDLLILGAADHFPAMPSLSLIVASKANERNEVISKCETLIIEKLTRQNNHSIDRVA